MFLPSRSMNVGERATLELQQAAFESPHSGSQVGKGEGIALFIAWPPLCRLLSTICVSI